MDAVVMFFLKLLVVALSNTPSCQVGMERWVSGERGDIPTGQIVWTRKQNAYMLVEVQAEACNSFEQIEGTILFGDGTTAHRQ